MLRMNVKDAGVLASLRVLRRAISGTWSSGNLILPVPGPVKPNISVFEPDAKIRDEISGLVTA